ncbi:transaldolase [Conexibacter sp. JD483]|uniref:transaldolase n=1 Tax=unclassified Conexibacter TaxID=2627773 RepID=UPI002715E880|nr:MULTISPECIES: transaldolase [unclassified Conexibacter]MDO8188922.1 transaldolase [Conexibacter sp. CPCC 205706]MDO8201704.1 transaldolase [Conexibacter sp. CPCC 205762]MDR9371455.1 transaldolase [Conexibacter sp. JD483]
MSATADLNRLGQSLWLDNITRDMLGDGTLAAHINERSVTGLTSNPTIFEHAVAAGDAYDDSIRASVEAGKDGEGAFFDLAVDDITRAADLFRPIHDKTDGVDGFVSLEVSPLLVRDTEATLEQAKELHARGDRPNLFIKIPGTPEGLPAIEEAIFAGIPVNVTLLFDKDQYLAAADAYLKGIERRVEAGLNPHVESVASIFISRWDVAVKDSAPEGYKNRLGIAVVQQAYVAYLELIGSARVQRLLNLGARPQRALWASTGTKDPEASDTLYIEAFASPLTVNTMPEKTLLAFHDHGTLGEPLARDGGDSEDVLAAFEAAGTDVKALAERLQGEGADAFAKSWRSLLEQIASKSQALTA